jgi:hypothetical protein
MSEEGRKERLVRKMQGRRTSIHSPVKSLPLSVHHRCPPTNSTVLGSTANAFLRSSAALSMFSFGTVTTTLLTQLGLCALKGSAHRRCRVPVRKEGNARRNVRSRELLQLCNAVLRCVGEEGANDLYSLVVGELLRRRLRLAVLPVRPKPAEEGDEPFGRCVGSDTEEGELRVVCHRVVVVGGPGKGGWEEKPGERWGCRHAKSDRSASKSGS